MIRGTFLNNFGLDKRSNRYMYDTYQRCRGSALVPSGMNIRRYNGKLYAIDPKSPLTARDFVTLLNTQTSVVGLTRVASKMGLRFKHSKAETKALICDALATRKIAEPVLLGATTKRVTTTHVNTNKTNTPMNMNTYKTNTPMNIYKTNTPMNTNTYKTNTPMNTNKSNMPMNMNTNTYKTNTPMNMNTNKSNMPMNTNKTNTPLTNVRPKIQPVRMNQGPVQGPAAPDLSALQARLEKLANKI